MRKLSRVVLSALLGAGSVFGATTNTWIGVAGTTPQTAGLWTEPANWKDGLAPVATTS